MSNRKVRVGAVSYLNTKPLIYGFEKGMMSDRVELVMDYPSNIAQALLKNEIDIGLVPVAIIPELEEYHIVGSHCIGCDGEVASVALFSEVPLEQIKTVLLDYQSRTSVKLAQVLMKEFWKIDPEISNGAHNFRDQITGNTAAVVIGDRAMEQTNISTYRYDLGLAWKQFTGLPFVFAAWISNKKLALDFIHDFDAVNEYSLTQLDKIVEANTPASYDLKKYYTEFINYDLTENKKRGLNAFLKKIETAVVTP
ncbi:MAG: menaquinone biosynthesis protein [Ferruginibacter sp.]|nr:menaquinone biosynthesis protein [Ferruginibacter sp.]